MSCYHGPTITLAVAALSAVAAAAMAAPAPVCSEGFDRGVDLPVGWRVACGSWRVADAALVVDALDGAALVTFGDAAWQNYEVEVTATFLKVNGDSRWLSVVFRAGSDGAPPWSQFPVRLKTTARNGAEMAVRLADGSWSVRKRAKAKTDSKLNRPRRLRVVVRGDSMEGYLDGKRLIRSPLCIDRRTGCVGLAASGCVARFDDFTVRRLPDTPPAVAAADLKPCGVVAHRGFSAVAPENTLVAIRAAVEAGADGCEFDVYASRDGHVVLMHDKTVDRTTNGHGRVTELTLAELRRLDAGSWKDPKFAGEGVPTLAEALRLLEPSKCRPIIEIKMEGISEKVIEDVRAAGMLDRAAVIAFSKDVVRDVRRLEPKLECWWLCGKELEGTAEQQAAWIAAEAADCDTKLVDLGYQMLSAEVVAKLRGRGLRVWTWTVNDPVVMAALARWGVEAITTDRPDLARQEKPRASSRSKQSRGPGSHVSDATSWPAARP